MSHTTLHWGQRKLLISEIIWLVDHWDPSTHPSPIFVYPGSMPGRHLNVLIRMFPQFTYVLYDTDRAPNGQARWWDLDSEIQAQIKNAQSLVHQAGQTEETKMITNYDQLENMIKQGGVVLVPKYFFDVDAEFFAAKFSGNCFLCTDIRDLTYTGMVKDLTRANAVVMKDMELQKRWVQLMRPVSSLLKFRLPWIIPGQSRESMTEYFTGQIYLQAWNGSTSSETRLCTDGIEMTRYSNKLYESMTFYHNNETREKDHYVVKVHSIAKDIDFDTSKTGYDEKFDSSMEIFVLSEYLRKYQFGGEVSLKIQELSSLIDKCLGGPNLKSRRENVSKLSKLQEAFSKTKHSLKQGGITESERKVLEANLAGLKEEINRAKQEEEADE